MIKPAALRPGDLVRLIAPSSPPVDETSLPQAIRGLESLGYRIGYSPGIFRRHGFLAGRDEERARDLEEAFADPEVKAVFCLRGGYGSGRLLSRLDWEGVCSHPKVFLGFSDLTAISCGLWVEGGLVTFSGPVALSDLHDGKPIPASWEHARSCFGSTKPIGSIFSHLFSREGVRVISPGSARGRLMGGNLSILCSLLGTPWQPDFAGSILFLEDVAEPTYRIDRSLTQLGNAGVLSAVEGVTLGDFSYSEDRRRKDEKRGVQVLDEVLADRLSGLGKPVVAGFPFGHIKPKATLPFGCMATLDGERGDLVIEEGAVQ
ncbi:MAG: LD-carboxypeptidase [Opitutae bacterium]|nr:LD-carboxypeptidase [Opitutae bacterium]